MDANKIKSQNYLKSPVEYNHPPKGHNLAREILDSLSLNADKTLIVDSQSNAKWTGSDILDRAGRIACALLDRLNLKPGQTVLVTSDHIDRELLMALGVFLAGLAFVPNDPNDGFNEVKTMCDLVQVSAIATVSRHHQLAAELRRQIPSLAQSPIIWIDDQSSDDIEPLDLESNNNSSGASAQYRRDMIEKDNVILLDDILEYGHLNMELIEHVSTNVIDADKYPAYYVLTSGSTGYPKAVEVTHTMCIHSIYSLLSSCWNSVNNDGQTIQLQLSENSVIAGDLPLDHGATITIILPSFRIGSKLVIIPPYEVDLFWQAVHDYGITISISGTSFIYSLLQHLKTKLDRSKIEWDLSTLRSMICIGSKLDFFELARQMELKFPNLIITQGYGCTEIGYIANIPPAEFSEHLDSVGYLMPGVEGKIVDISDGDKVLGPNERGELLVWANSKFDRYLCRPGIDSRAAFEACHDSNNFYRTGDLAHYDLEGRLYLHGRIKETLVLGQDWKIMPAELESMINEHPLVEFSVVIGLPDPNNPVLHIPRAFIKLISKNSIKYKKLMASSADTERQLFNRLVNQDLTFIADDIYRFSAARTSEVKHLRAGVKILDEFPLVGPLKKVDRKVLRQMQ